ncbi:Histone H1-like protein [Candidatus Protochlamydia naegleriophila]|uniref:Histone H1-like protein n=1 Tax=Candidatus Protochlamydia naegleriophila TaxID=389348 RepID=A0A0U5JIR9_9BACT|nr:histone [Candidatus Protochlamydia naegleriophila]CUI17702.1 Histone H1-like protein [Candidatus Protochlamydia naegleriophila]
MSLKDTFKQLRELLANITTDLEKSENGNKAASQRVRTGTVKLEKIAKLFRKESISSEKKNKGQKKPAKAAPKAGKSVAAAKSKPAAASKAKAAPAAKKAAAVKAKPKAKSTSFRPRQMSVKRATAKLPTKRVGSR